MKEEMKVKICLVLIASIITMIIMFSDIIKRDEQIKQLEQSLQEQIQEVEVYRGILEEYQTEGIINE